mmetsp:Transcript_14845/g.22338  ORF Transcript_14845/g.22338 Transcript_14845/m.22338 type:complete len:208 (+) Transcript_14845:81-704(+)
MPVTASSVLLFYPNLIGYARILFMFMSFYFALSSWQLTLVFYLLAFGGDAIDGFVARACKQSSKFGGILDMVTDRVSTCGFLFMLSHLYPDWKFSIVLLICIDIFSHWFHVMSVSGHHKASETLEKRNFILRWYYAVPFLFAYCCIGAELFYVLLYTLKFYPHPWIFNLCFYGCLPGCAIKQVVNLAQLASAAYSVAEIDASEKKAK